MLFWVLDSLKCNEHDTIWLGMVHSVERQYRVISQVLGEFPNLDIRRVDLRFRTRGAAETLYILLQNMSAHELRRPTISIDCHTFYRSDILDQFRSLPEGMGCSFFFEDDGVQPLFSYLMLDDDGFIDTMAEKQKISNKANTGAYGFSSALELKAQCAHVMDHVHEEGPGGNNAAYYVSSIIARMISCGHKFKGIHTELLHTVNNPQRLNEFLMLLQRHPEMCARKMRFCFDLDNTLVTRPRIAHDYTTVDPVVEMIQLVRELKDAGHVIIIHSDRGMSRHDGNVGRIMAELGPITFKTLADFNIPYDEIYFGKPHADIYIDDKSAASMNGNVRKQIGWYDGMEGLDPSMIQARQFNHVVVQNNEVIKTAPRSVLEGEIYFYRHVPDPIASLFPKLLSSDIKDAPEVCSLSMDRVPGVTFSHMLVNRCITRHRLLLMLKALHEIHSVQQAGVSTNPDGSTVDDATVQKLIYANYEKKVSERYRKYRDVYRSFMRPDDFYIVNSILDFLHQYERGQRATYASVIHGDPVFSNILLKADNSVAFLDMRGCLGQTMTMAGDVVYDLAKVYQSLGGYDYILLDQPILNSDQELLNDLQECFAEFVGNHYTNVRMEDVKMITASHYFSLIPLHVEASIDRKILFWQRCKLCVV